MRLVAGLLAVMLAAPLASADEPAPPPAPRPEAKSHIPLRVVRVMPESNQALLFDRTRNTHVLVEVGQTVDGYAVDDIGDDEVTLSASGKQIVLAAPMRGGSRRGDGARPGRVRSASADPNTPADPYDDGVRVAEAPGAPVTPGAGGVRVATATPSDPYEEPVRSVSAPDPGTPSSEPAPRVVHAPAAEAPADPYAGEAPRVVHAPPTAPADPYAGEAPRVVEAPAGTPAAPRVVEAPAATPAAPRVAEAPAAAAPHAAKPTAKEARKAHDAAEARAVAELFADTATATKPTTKAPASAAAPAARPGQVTLARTEVDAALSDFGQLAAAIHGQFGPTGVTIDGVAAGSLFERAGLRAGDTIASVNGVVPRSLDDAANIYALASSVKTMTVLLVRDGKQTALRIAIQ